MATSRTYRQKARRLFIGYSKNRKRTARQTRKVLGQQLRLSPAHEASGVVGVFVCGAETTFLLNQFFHQCLSLSCNGYYHEG